MSKMVEIIGFDSILFKRSWRELEVSQVDSNIAEEHYKAFVSPLGCGALVDNYLEFRGEFLKAFAFQASEFQLRLPFLFMPSSNLIDIMGIPKTLPFVDRLIHQIQHTIKALHVSFITLPVGDLPTVRVGGLQSPAREEPTRNYLAELQNPMPYLTAYSFRGSQIGRGFSGKMVLDSFESKRTRAWDRLVGADMEVYSHGDECHPLICLADLMCFLINSRLYGMGSYEDRRLDYKNVKNVLTDFSFSSGVHRFDETTKEAYVHYNYRSIEFMSKIKHPVTFLVYDPPDPQTGVSMKEVVTERLWYPALKKAYMSEGCMKRFNWDTDAQYVDDGDTMVCVGELALKKAKALAMTARIEVLTGLQFRDKMMT